MGTNSLQSGYSCLPILHRRKTGEQLGQGERYSVHVIALQIDVWQDIWDMPGFDMLDGLRGVDFEFGDLQELVTTPIQRVLNQYRSVEQILVPRKGLSL
jgi:hypothetical protein